MAGMVGHRTRPLARSSPSPFPTAAAGHVAGDVDLSIGPPAWPAGVKGRREEAVSVGRSLRRSAFWLSFLTMAVVCLPAMGDPSRAVSVAQSAAALPLEVMSHADAERVGAVGTGCTWRGGPDNESRLSMADNRAAVRRNGVVIVLKPAKDATTLFLTYDRWIADGMRIVIHDTGKVIRRGREFSETAAWMDLTMEGHRQLLNGALNCGS